MNDKAFSDKPMSFIDQGPKNFLAAIIDVVAVETGDRAARERWQQRQLQNLLRHAAQSSAFWRARIGTRKIDDITLAALPVLTRRDLARQVETEGSLLPRNSTIATKKHSTSGSSGTPVQFFVSDMNGQYNNVRTVAQYFIEGRDLTLNRTRFKPSRDRLENGFRVEKSKDWLGPLSAIFRSGLNKEITHLHPNRDLLLQELSKDPIGYLVVQPRVIEMLFHDSDVSFLSESRTAMFIPVAEEADKALRDKFAAVGIPVRGNYSSEEAGYIGAECPECPETYHVAQSNVIVETDDSVDIGGNTLGRVLVTSLHSYASPLVRYELGDFATLMERCPCGHDGPALSNIYGQKKRLLKRADGSIVPFSMKAGNILSIVKCDEYRIRQNELSALDVEIGGIEDLSSDQLAALEQVFKKQAGEQFKIRIKAVRNIDWGNDIKRLGFRSDLF